jgi:hypothetical protein
MMKICPMTRATSPTALIATHLELKDPRAAHSIEHKPIDMLKMPLKAAKVIVMMSA